MTPPRQFVIGVPIRDTPVTSHFQCLAATLASRGHIVLLLVPHRRVDLVSRTTNPEVLTWPSDRSNKLTDVRFLLQLIRARKPDCVVGNFSAVNLMIGLGAIQRVKSRVAWYHTLSTQSLLDTRRSAARQVLLRLRKALVYRLATHVVCTSTAALSDLQSTYSVPAEKCVQLVNSLQDPLATTELTSVTTCASKVVCVGRLYPSKGQDVLLRAIHHIFRLHPNLQVEFIGSGPEASALQSLASSLGLSGICSFQGSLPHNAVLRAMASAALIVTPSRSEAFGLVNIESMAVGKPVIASNVGGIPEIVEHGRTGILVPPDDSRSLAAALSTVLTDAHLRERMGFAARARFLQRYEQSTVVPQQADWLESTI